LSPVWNLVPASQTATAPDIAMDARGNAVFAWIRGTYAVRRLETRSRLRSGELTALQTIATFLEDDVVYGGPRVVVDAAGNATFTWMRCRMNDCRVKARARAADGTLGPVVNVSGAGRWVPIVTAAANGAGDVAFSWIDAGDGVTRVMMRTRAASGDLGPIRTVSGSEGAVLEDHLHVGLDTAGNATVVWGTRTVDPIALKARTYRPDAGWTTAETLTTSVWSGQALMVTPEGSALVVYADGASDAALVAREGP
jgi:hypothetical protein